VITFSLTNSALRHEAHGRLDVQIQVSGQLHAPTQEPQRLGGPHKLSGRRGEEQNLALTGAQTPPHHQSLYRLLYIRVNKPADGDSLVFTSGFIFKNIFSSDLHYYFHYATERIRAMPATTTLYKKLSSSNTALLAY
jgi:hypothetical protein